MATPEISVATESLPGSRVGLTIEVPPLRVDQAYQRVLDRLAQRVKVEGFRPGKAPRALVEARLGPATLRDEVIDFLVPPLVAEALRERSIEAVDRPRVEVRELERGRPGKFVATVSVWPEVTLPDLDSLAVEHPRTEVTEEAVERRLQELRERLAEIEPVDREVRDGDVVVGDLRVVADGEEMAGEGRSAMELEVREGVLIPELLAVLPGKRVGEVAVAETKMADDHANPALRGRQATLEVTVQGVKEKRVPELDDEVAKQLSNGEQESAAAFREALRADLAEQGRRLDELAFEQQVVRAVVDHSQVEIPESLVKREVDREVDELEHRLGHRGLRLDRYFEYLGKDEAGYRTELQPDAEARIRVDLVLGEVGKKLGIEPAEAEVTEYLRAEAAKDQELSGRGTELESNPVARDYFRHRLTRIRILEALTSRLGGDAEGIPTPPANAAEPAPQATETKEATPAHEAD